MIKFINTNNKLVTKITTTVLFFTFLTIIISNCNITLLAKNNEASFSQNISDQFALIIEPNQIGNSKNYELFQTSVISVESSVKGAKANLLKEQRPIDLCFENKEKIIECKTAKLKLFKTEQNTKVKLSNTDECLELVTKYQKAIISFKPCDTTNTTVTTDKLVIGGKEIDWMYLVNKTDQGFVENTITENIKQNVVDKKDPQSSTEATAKPEQSIIDTKNETEIAKSDQQNKSALRSIADSLSNMSFWIQFLVGLIISLLLAIIVLVFWKLKL